MKQEYLSCRIADIAEKVAMGPFGSNIKVETFVPAGIPVISGSHLKGFYLEESDFNFITEEHAQRLKNSIVYPGDIIFTHAGNVGQVAMIPYNCHYPFYMISQRQFYLRCDKKKVIPEYLVYYFHSHEGQGKLLSNVSQVGVPSIAQPSSFLKTIEVPLPSLEIQSRIVNVLDSFTKKIEVNNQINRNLEEQAKAFYLQLQEKKDSQNWAKMKAEDVFGISIGKTPPRKESQWFSDSSEDTVWVSIADMGRSGLFIADSSEYLKEEAVSRFNIPIVPKDSILLSFKLTIGRVSITDCDLTTNEAIAHFVMNDCIYREYLYFYLKLFNYQSMGNTSSIATAVNSKIIKSMLLDIPPVEELRSFHKKVEPLFSKIRINQKENKALSVIRDTLLPKLMSGEIEPSL